LASDNDWRLAGDRTWLIRATLVLKSYRRRSETWEHDHCEYCWAVFSDPTFPHDDSNLHQGYSMMARDRFADDQIWICRTCFEDFKDRFQWTVVEA
jgi:hypothetical protein